MKPIGLLGGTFDPIHNGHLRIALEVAETFSLEEVRMIPVNVPSHRALPEASAFDRCEMISSVETYPLILDDVEIQRGGISYSIDTLEYLKKELIDSVFCLILGADAFRSIKSWHRANDLFSLTNVVVVARGEVAKIEKESFYLALGGKPTENPEDLKTASGFVYFMDAPIMQVASSKIREKIKLGRSIKGLVPSQVEKIIREKKLYKNG